MRFAKSKPPTPVLPLVRLLISSVIALSKLYSLNDHRLAQIQVKGDLIVAADDGKIKTRSRAKQSKPWISLYTIFRRPPLTPTLDRPRPIHRRPGVPKDCEGPY